MNPCPHCGQPVDPGAQICPHCGADRRAVVWPPPVEGNPQPGPPPTWYKTGAAWGDIVVGIILTGGSFLACGIGALVMPFVYFSERREHPLFARVVGWTYLVSLALVGGAFYTCVSGSFMKF